MVANGGPYRDMETLQLLTGSSFWMDVDIGVTDRLASAWEDLVAVEGLGHDMGCC